MSQDPTAQPPDRLPPESGGAADPHRGSPTGPPGRDPQEGQHGQPGQQGQPGHGGHYGQPPAGPPPPAMTPAYPTQPPDHPQSMTALVLGIISVAGAVVCYLPILGAPFAWYMGAKVRGEIRASGGRYGGEGQATAGMVLGIIGTVLLVLAVIALIAIGLFLFAFSADIRAA